MSKKDQFQFRYAINRDGKEVHISSVPDNYHDYGKKGDFRCIECGADMEAHIGKKRISHFQHCNKSDDLKCCGQGALHKHAILAFIEAYKRRIDDGSSFSIEMKTECLCDQKSLVCGKKEPCRKDNGYLKKHLLPEYNECRKEVYDDGFIPDILLKNERGDKVYVEIVVTHYSAPKKIHSGTPIIEVKIDSLEDCQWLLLDQLSERNEKVKCYGFPEAHILFHCNPERELNDLRNYTYDYYVDLLDSGESWSISYNDDSMGGKPLVIRMSNRDWSVVPLEENDFSPNFYFRNRDGEQIRMNFAKEFSPKENNPFGKMKTIQIVLSDTNDCWQCFPNIQEDGLQIQLFNFCGRQENLSCREDMVSPVILCKDGLISYPEPCKNNEVMEKYWKKFQEMESCFFHKGVNRVGNLPHEIIPALWLSQGKFVYSCYVCENYIPPEEIGGWEWENVNGQCKKRGEDVYCDNPVGCRFYNASMSLARRRLKAYLGDDVDEIKKEFASNQLKRD